MLSITFTTLELALCFASLLTFVSIILALYLIDTANISIHIERSGSRPYPTLALPDYRSKQAPNDCHATLTWYPVPALQETLITVRLPHCSTCLHPYEDDSTYFCGYCGTPSDSLTQ